jgi:hypothetical protein
VELSPIVVVILCVLLSACGSSNDHALAKKFGVTDPSSASTPSSNPATTGAPTTAAPTTAPPPSAGFTTAASWAFDFTKADTGDSMHVTLVAGRFTRAADAPTFAGDREISSSGCGVDAQRDLVAPATLTVTNTNNGFDQKVSVTFYAYRTDKMADTDDAVVDVAAYYAKGPSCLSVTPWDSIDGGQGWGLSSLNAVASGHSVTVNAFIILKGALSPASPNGDPVLFATTRLYPNIGATITGKDTITNQVGPWQPSSTSGDAAFQTIPLAPLAMQ